MRIVIANPPGFGGPDYDHHLCSALAARGEDVELVTTRFRFGQMPDPEGYRRSLVFYPLSARLFGRSRLRVPVKVAEHPFGLAQLALRHPDVVHVQWLSIPEVDRVLLRSRAPLVYTAHDNAQRRTSSKKRVWDALYRRFQRVVIAFSFPRWRHQDRAIHAGLIHERDKFAVIERVGQLHAGSATGRPRPVRRLRQPDVNLGVDDRQNFSLL